MNFQLNKLLAKLTPAAQAEVATFAAYLLARRREQHSILELKGLGKEAWGGIDVQEYVHRERRSWPG